MPRINVCLSKLKIHINTIGNFQTKYSSAFIKNTLFYRLYSLGRRSQIVSKVSCHPETRPFSNNENSWISDVDTAVAATWWCNIWINRCFINFLKINFTKERAAHCHGSTFSQGNMNSSWWIIEKTKINISNCSSKMFCPYLFASNSKLCVSFASNQKANLNDLQ